MNHRVAREAVRRFAQAADVPAPRVFSDPLAFEKHMAHRGGLTKNERLFLRKGYGFSVKRVVTRDVVFFNLPRHETRGELLHTAAHEVLHLRTPSLRHGAEFERRVQWLLAGQSLGPRGSRLPEGFASNI